MEKQKHPSDQKQSDDSEEVSIDFSKIKNMFKSKTKSEKQKDDSKNSLKISDKKSQSSTKDTKSDDDGFEFDMKGIGDFFVKYRALFLILIPLFLAIFLRAQSASLPITDDWAKQTIVNNIQAQIRTQIDANYPNLPDQNKQALVDQQYAAFEKDNKLSLDQQISQTSLYFKSQLQDDEGLTYFMALDPYYWLRHAKNIVNNGQPGDELIDEKPYDTYMLAPIGREVPKDMLYAYIIAYSYKTANFFTAISIEKVSFYLPLLLAALSVIPAFFIARKFAGDVGGFFAAMLIATQRIFLSRSMAGISKTDTLNIFFPLMITWLYLEAFENESTLKSVILATLSGLFAGVYTFGWSGWWYIFDFILVTNITYIIYYMLKHRKEIKSNAFGFFKKKNTWMLFLILIIFFVSAMICAINVTSKEVFTLFYSGPIGFINIHRVAIDTIWPNVFTTVAEQNASSITETISSMGGNFLFFISLLGILITLSAKNLDDLSDDEKKFEIWFLAIAAFWLLLSIIVIQTNVYYLIAAIVLPIVVRMIIDLKSKSEGIDFKFAFLMTLWFAATLFASIIGVRFSLLLVPAFCVAFGVFAGIFYTKFSDWISKEMRITSKLTKPATFIMLLLVIIGPISVSYVEAKSRSTDFNRAWYDALSKIDSESAPNAIINSWWDFGHWFKYFGNRAVTFDGTSQEYPPVHWIGRVLVTDNEKEAVDILRMLDCGNYMGTTRLNEFVKDDLKTVKIMKKIISLNKTEANKYLLSNRLDSNQAKSVLEYTHCDAPEDYFITSDDMVLKSRVWAHFGLWDFDKAAIHSSVKNYTGNDPIKFIATQFNLDESVANQYYYDIQTIDANDWISPWPSYLTAISPCYTNDNITIYCDNGLIFNTSSKDAQLSLGVGRKLKSVVYANKDGIKEKIIDPIGDISAAIYPKGDSYFSILMDPQLANSMFTKLYFFRGHGLKYFKLFDYQRSIFGTDIYVWKIDWEGKEKNIIEEFNTTKINSNINSTNNNSNLTLLNITDTTIFPIINLDENINNSNISLDNLDKNTNNTNKSSN